MHVDENHPGLKKFREARARKKKLAILREEIKKNNPKLSHNQAQEIAKASLRAQEASAATTIKVQGRKGKGKGRKRHSKPKAVTVKVQVVNRLS